MVYDGRLSAPLMPAVNFSKINLTRSVSSIVKPLVGLIYPPRCVLCSADLPQSDGE